MLCYHEAMTALFNNFTFVFLCRTVKTSRHSGKQTKTGNAECCTLKTTWAKCLFALEPGEQPTDTGDGWWRMGCRNWSLLGAWEEPRVSGWWALCLLGAAGGGLPSSPFHAREGGMLGKGVRGGRNVLVGIFQRQISFSLKICALFSVKAYGNWVHCGLQSCGRCFFCCD